MLGKVLKSFNAFDCRDLAFGKANVRAVGRMFCYFVHSWANTCILVTHLQLYEACKTFIARCSTRGGTQSGLQSCPANGGW